MLRVGNILIQSRYYFFVLLLVTGKTDGMIRGFNKIRCVFPVIQKFSCKNNLTNKIMMRAFGTKKDGDDFEDIKKFIEVRIKKQNYFEDIQKYEERMTCAEIKIEEFDYKLDNIDDMTFGEGSDREQYSKVAAYKQFKGEIEEVFKKEKERYKEKINWAESGKYWSVKMLDKVDDVYCDLAIKLNLNFEKVEEWYLKYIDKIDSKGTFSSKPKLLVDTMPCINRCEGDPQKIVIGTERCNSDRKKTKLTSLKDYYFSNQKYCRQCLFRIITKYQKITQKTTQK